jgi:glucose/arabinose dehydrogenase
VTSNARWLSVWRFLGLGALLLAAGIGSVAASVLPPGFQETLVVSGRVQPTAIKFAPNGHIFVAEKSGLLWLYEGIADTSPNIVVDLRTEVHNFWDRGLLGLAVAPNYPADNRVYVTYAFDAFSDGTFPRWGTAGSTTDNCPNPPGATASGCVVYGRLASITVNQSTLTGTPSVLLSGNWCAQYPSHTVGDLIFGSDGYLYLSAGDGANFSGGIADYGQLGGNPCGDPTNEGGALRVQDILTPGDPTSYDGAVLRLDVSGGGVAAAPGNPLIGNAVADDDYIIAVGLRNPFRMAQRPGTGEIWVSDVGWGTWEEINVISAPASPVENFGWPCYEGGNNANVQLGSYSSLANCQNLYSGNIPAGIQLRSSHYGYLHSASVAAGDGCPTGGSAVTGIAFNTGTSYYPSNYNGALFFADSARQCAWTMLADGSGVPNRNTIQVLVSQASGRIVDLEMGNDGRLYYVDFDGGRVYRIDYFPANAPPTAAFSATPPNGPAPLLLQFDASSSSDPEDGNNLAYAWDLDGDGQFDDSTLVNPAWTYAQPGIYAVSLRVTDSGNLTDTETLLINAGGSPPTVTIASPPSGTTWAVGDIINFSGEARDNQNNLLPASMLVWDVILHHCYTVENCHTHPLTSFPGVSFGSFEAPDHEYPSFINLKLTANPLPAGWWNADWTRRIRLTMNNSGQAEDLTNFPVLVTINSNRIAYADARPDAADLRFTDSAGNVLPHEIETWNTNGDSHVWVRVSTVAASSSSGFIYMYYGNPNASSTANGAAVWSGYGGVWHLNGNANDSTANANNGTQVNTVTVAGRMGDALNFNGNAYVDVLNPNGLAITGTLTGEAWIKIADPAQPGNPRVFDKKGSPWTSASGYTLQYKPGANNITGLGGGSNLLRAEPIDLDTSWHYIAAVYNGNGTGRVYLNGVDVTTDGTVGNLVANTTRFRIGQQTWGGEAWQGALDEIRVSPLARTGAWMRAQNLSMRDQFLTYSLPEGAGIGSSLSASAALFLAPRTSDITIASLPSGLTLTLGSRTEPAPYTQTVIENSLQQLTAAPSQVVGSTNYNFLGWSDGGAATHLFAAPVDDLTLTATYTAGAPNSPPSVSITSPLDGAVIPAPGAVEITVDASDPDGPVQRVEFFDDGTLIATDYDAPWSTFWNATTGSHNLSARAFDVPGLSTTSSPVAVTVNAPNNPPTVSITSPADGTVYPQPGSVTITANASDAEGPLQRVEFYVGAALIGSDTTSPYSIAWDSTVGAHVLTAVAVDSANLQTTSSPVNVTVNQPGSWFNPAWTRRVQLTINNSGQAENLTDFQVLVVLNDSRISYAEAQASGADIRFTDLSGTTLLPYEIETWNPAGTSYIWVRVPSIAAGSTTDHIYMYYGNPSATSAADAAGVWAGYGGVWHLNGNANDSTSNGNNGVQINTTTVAGYMGNALNFNGSAYVDVTNPVGLAITGTLTGEAWIKINNPAQTGNPRVFDKKNSPWTSTSGYTLQYKPGSNNITGLGGGSDLLRAEPIDLDTSWHHIAAVYNGNGTGRIYLNGVDVTTDGTVGLLVANTTRFRMGQQTWGGEAWQGAIDEIRVSPLARTAAWMRAQNLSMRDTFLTYGAPQAGP